MSIGMAMGMRKKAGKPKRPIWRINDAAAALTVSVAFPDIPPPGAAFTTEMFAVPVVVRLAGSIRTINWLPLMKEVA